MYRFTCNTEPIGKGRPRARSIGKGIMLYTPKQTQEFEAEVRKAFLQSIEGTGICANDLPVFGGDKPLKVTLEFNMSIPKSFSKKKRTECLTGEIVPTKKPDIDNLIKSILDALNGLMYEDDKQVIEIVASKRYADLPSIEIWCDRWQER